MSDPEVLYRFTPHSEGARINGVPQRDLTAADLPNIAPGDLRDAITPHPVYGKPLYTAVANTEDGRPPKWFQDKLAKAEKDGVVIAPLLLGETQKAYEERVAAMTADPPSDDGDPPNNDDDNDEGGDA